MHVLDFNPVHFAHMYYDKHNLCVSLFLSLSLLFFQHGLRGFNPVKTCQD